MILDIPEWAVGWYYHDDDKDINVVDKNAPKEVVKLYKDFDKEYFDTYEIHFFKFSDGITDDKKTLWDKIKSFI